MSYPEGYTVATYSQFFKRKARVNYLSELINKYDQLEVLNALSRSNLLIFDRPKYSSNQNILISNFFNRKTINKFSNEERKLKREDAHFAWRLSVFNRIQFLYLFQKAFLLCISKEKKKELRLKKDRIRFGKLLLMANELTYEGENIDKRIEDEKKKYFLLYFLRRYENNNIPHLKHEIVRNNIILNEILNQDDLKEEYNNLKIDRFFKLENKISLSEYLDVIFCIIAIFTNRLKNPNLFIENYSSTRIQKSNLSKTILKNSVVSNLLKSLSLDTKNFSNQIEDDINKFPSYSFLSFRKHPLFRIKKHYYCIDLGFLIEKVCSNIFWKIQDSLPQTHRGRFHDFWGIVFERYVDSVFERIYTPTSPLSNYYPHPASENNEEVIDGILDYQSSIIMFEFKSSFLPINIKFSPDLRAFENEVKKKLKLKNFAKKVKKIFIERSLSLNDIDINNVEKIFPVLITLERCYQSEFMNWHINKIFNKYIPNNSQIEVFPIQILTINELEYLEPYLEGGFDFCEILKGRLRFDEKMNYPFSYFINNESRFKPKKSNQHISKEYRKWAQQIKRRIFGGKDIQQLT